MVDVGLASTDLVYFASGSSTRPAAMFTASHNPAQYNGIKMCRAAAAPVGEATGLRPDQGGGRGRAASSGPRRPGRVEHADLLADFAEHVRSFVDPTALRAAAGRGRHRERHGRPRRPGGVRRPPVRRSRSSSRELDGTFPNHPADPIQPENLVVLQKAVLEAGADVGLAFDGDADRVFLVDDQAQPISGSTTTAIVAKAILEQTGPGETVVYNLICSKAVPEVIREMGGTPVRYAGRALVHQAGHGRDRRRVRRRALRRTTTSATTGAPTPGSSPRWSCSSSSAAPDVPLSELRKPFERYAQSGEINTAVADPPR